MPKSLTCPRGHRWEVAGDAGDADLAGIVCPECGGAARTFEPGGAAMRVTLAVTSGPHAGREFTFDRHDTFLVGRGKDAHLQLSYDDPYFSRRHFLVEVNPPRCRVIDLNSRNGVRVNGKRVFQAELNDGDELAAGHTVFKVSVDRPDPDAQSTLDLPAGDPLGVGRAAAGVPGYRLGRELGRGAFGVVHEAVREADGSAVAVKVMTPAAGATTRQVEKFLREARILTSLRHPHIVGCSELGRAGESLYLVMELVDGPDAGRWVKEKGPLPERAAVRLMCQVLAGLAHAHAAGYVHRDVKPANILVGGGQGKRVAKLADFGLARAYEACQLSGLTMQGEVGGTPAYMAPEQVTHYRDVRPAADQYAAAATLYSLLTTAYPHDPPADRGGWIAHILTADPVPLRRRRADVRAGLADAVHRALARDPADRFPDVSAFRAALVPFAV